MPYLNARPLLGDVRCELAVPSELARRFAVRRYDAALVPAFDAVRHARATVADGACIGSDGEVFSVFLAYRGDLRTQTAVALDPDSRTSSHLLQIVLAEFLRLDCRVLARPESEQGARLLIGDPAIAFRRAHADGDWSFLDLGQAWKDATGLPFVFALWVISPHAPRRAELVSALRAMKSQGLAKRPIIAAAEPDPAFAEEYLHRFIRYELGDPEKHALQLYATLLRKHRLVDDTEPCELEFI